MTSLGFELLLLHRRVRPDAPDSLAFLRQVALVLALFGVIAGLGACRTVDPA